MPFINLGKVVVTKDVASSLSSWKVLTRSCSLPEAMTNISTTAMTVMNMSMKMSAKALSPASFMIC